MNKQFDRDLGARIRMLRQFKSLTQKRLAEQIGISFQQLQKYERGINQVSTYRLCQMAIALECSPAYLMQGAVTNTDAKQLPFETFKLIRFYETIPDSKTRRIISDLLQILSQQRPPSSCA